MLRCFVPGHQGGVVQIDDPDADDLRRAIWVDLIDPTRGESLLVSTTLDIQLPSRAIREEIETSSRLYVQNGAHFMTCALPLNPEILIHSSWEAKKRGAHADLSTIPVTFITAGEVLLTIRQGMHRAFETFTQTFVQQKVPVDFSSSRVMLALIDGMIERLADQIEALSRDINQSLRSLFDEQGALRSRGRLRRRSLDDHRQNLCDLSRTGIDLNKIKESLVSLERLSLYLRLIMPQDLTPKVRLINRDVISLTDYVVFLSEKLTFLLNALLGSISIEQNASAKVFSTVSVLFLPPMFLASVYGMNFRQMPELEWTLGYPAAIVSMVVLAVVAYVVFRRGGLL